MSMPVSNTAATGDGAKTVLFIEGTLASLPLVEAVLARLPRVRVLPAMQGRRGLELARSLQPSLILLDLVLPDMRGSAVLQQLQADGRTRAIPVITLGSSVTAPLAAHLMNVGARAHFTQPLDIGRFLRLLQQLLA